MHASIHDRVLGEVKERIRAFRPGLPEDWDTTMGAIVNHAQYDRILSHIEASKKDGATRYLQSSAGGVLTEKVRPLVTGALESVGAYRQLDQLGRNSQLLSLAGVSHDRLTDSVTEQALKGIFLYMGNEEAALRKNPGKLLKGVF